MFMTDVSKEALEVIMNWIACIHYLIQFQKDKEATIWALIDVGSKINAISPAYISKLDFKIWAIDIWAQKINVSLLQNFEIIIASLQVLNKLGRAWFF